MTRNKDFYLLLIAYALVEIRAMGDGASLSTAKQIADMLHNIPEGLRLEWTKERDSRIYAYIRSKAEMYNLTEMLDGWERAALRRIRADQSTRDRGQ